MEALGQDSAAFDRLGPAAPATALVVSVPHAGRCYPSALIEAALLPVATLVALEDRFVDRLVADLPALGATVLVARNARAWIDLNRDERELDPAMLLPAAHRPERMIASAKVRGGLGLIPRRIAGAGEIWRRRFGAAEIEARVMADHRPWHDAIAGALGAARARFGVALLVELHSMPPIASTAAGAAARIVLGDRHGRSSADRFVARLRAVAHAGDLPVACNEPYAGGYTLDRHARPRAGIHAIQIEIDRSLYLAADLRATGPGLERTTALVTRFAHALLAELAEEHGREPLAAE